MLWILLKDFVVKACLHASQVMNLIMCEEKPLTSFTDEELLEDPLVALPCKHVLVLSSVDGSLELDSFYYSTTTASRAKTWSLDTAALLHPHLISCTLASSCFSACNEAKEVVLDVSEAALGSWSGFCVQGEHQPGKCCPQCRTPISGLFRYGSSLKKRAIDTAQRTFLQDAGGRLRQAEEGLSTAEIALIDWKGTAATTACRFMHAHTESVSVCTC
jgi:hypothetical protein